ncbi:MAG: putative restriction endonuclease [Desulfobacteraceae bacterium Eth-SRB1]|nr:MAG: putative restriction endonuclease [Desulfobacteraceae bacterium Eth-SRB1]
MSNVTRKPWTREELILAINLYCKIPFGRIHVRNPDIIKLSELLNRTPGSVSYKLANFASIDPSLDRKGASNVSKLDKEVWNDFYNDWEKMAFESEQKAFEICGKRIGEAEKIEIPEGKTTESIIKTRVNQSFFRKMILSSYNSKCCITGLPVEKLLVASHIIPWAQDTQNRLNPQNGLCLNALHDKAFDIGLITIDESYCVVISTEIRNLNSTKAKMILDYEGITMTMPNRFIPSQEFLSYHREKIFIS